MSQTIQIKRSDSATISSFSPAAGELAYVSTSGTDKLYIGHPDGSTGAVAIGGASYMSKLDGIDASATANSDESIQDLVGAMVSGNTETGITVTYQDADGTLDFTVATQSDVNFTSADHTKLDGIETSADVTDATNVTAAGALMDSEVTNLAEVKAFDASDYATAAQGQLATDALPKAGGAMTGAVSISTASVATPALTLTNTDDGSGNSPTLELTRTSTSPAADDHIGQIVFKGKDLSGGDNTYAKISAQITDATNGSEDGKLYFGVPKNGNFTTTLGMDADAASFVGDVLVAGDLIVSGSTTTINTEEIELADNYILLNSNLTGDPADNIDTGIEINRGNYTNVKLFWDESDTRWMVQEAPDGAGQASANYALLHTGNSSSATYTIDGGTW
jgi:hypothetical protein